MGSNIKRTVPYHKGDTVYIAEDCYGKMRVIEVTVTRTTPKTFWTTGRSDDESWRWTKQNWSPVRRTWDEARQHLVDLASDRLAAAERKLGKADRTLIQILSMDKPPHLAGDE